MWTGGHIPVRVVNVNFFEIFIYFLDFLNSGLNIKQGNLDPEQSLCPPAIHRFKQNFCCCCDTLKMRTCVFSRTGCPFLKDSVSVIRLCFCLALTLNSSLFLPISFDCCLFVITRIINILLDVCTYDWSATRCQLTFCRSNCSILFPSWLWHVDFLPST
jgi:hypothetical protein